MADPRAHAAELAEHYQRRWQSDVREHHNGLMPIDATFWTAYAVGAMDAYNDMRRRLEPSGDKLPRKPSRGRTPLVRRLHGDADPDKTLLELATERKGKQQSRSRE